MRSVASTGSPSPRRGRLSSPSCTSSHGWRRWSWRISSTSRSGWRGQAFIEFALVLPLLLLLLVGGLFLGLMLLHRMALQPMAWEGASAAAREATDATRCQAARDAIDATSGRSYAACDGSDGLLLDVDPLTSVPRAARVTLTDQLGAPPLIAFATDGEVSARAGAVIAP